MRQHQHAVPREDDPARPGTERDVPAHSAVDTLQADQPGVPLMQDDTVRPHHENGNAAPLVQFALPEHCGDHRAIPPQAARPRRQSRARSHHWRSATSQADSILIVDEPTSALDPEAEIEAFNRIRRLAALNRAVVLVTHRMSGVRHADRIYVLNAGHLAEHGTHDELITAHGRYAAMFDAQAAQYTPTPSIPKPASPTITDPA